eukprot:TRINITY_DN19666_c0_g2_i2.p1 TRINITY_DN19666_c0_g2~~TRINITY_DN19666_c0_g2_i2.p1  ORF type:complete len:122 (+),score=8.29 TRINITY_DN19666_c0_g2_i2:54-368(+)
MPAHTAAASKPLPKLSLHGVQHARHAAPQQIRNTRVFRCRWKTSTRKYRIEGEVYIDVEAGILAFEALMCSTSGTSRIWLVHHHMQSLEGTSDLYADSSDPHSE